MKYINDTVQIGFRNPDLTAVIKQTLTQILQENAESLFSMGILKPDLTAMIKEAVKQASRETAEESLFPLYDTRKVALLFNVSRPTVRNWFKQGLLPARYQVLSGRACKLIFTYRDLVQFLNQNFPHAEDFGDKCCSPRTSKAKLLERMFRMNRLYTRRRLKPKVVDGFYVDSGHLPPSRPHKTEESDPSVRSAETQHDRAGYSRDRSTRRSEAEEQ